MYITVEEFLDKNRKEQWVFYIRDEPNRIEVVFNEFRSMSRPTSRHRKWSCTNIWEWRNGRRSSLPTRPEVPARVVAQAIRQLNDSICIVLDRT